MNAPASTQTHLNQPSHQTTPPVQTARPVQISDKLLETGLLPDALIRWGISRMLAQKLREHQRPSIETEQANLMAFVAELSQSPLAIETHAANAQHYEVPAAFFQQTLGPHLKYSCALWEPGCQSLEQAEAAMLALYAERAQLENGQRILELGCGWGSLSLWMAQRFPASQIVTVSNSASQKAFIDAQAKARGLTNLAVITANMIHFDASVEAPGPFDRIVSIEMMEHLKNYGLMFERIQRWLTPEGKLFVHIFTHRKFAYHYEDSGDADNPDWLTRHFFSGGTMPSADLFHYFQKHLTLEAQWAVNGTHYEKTANAWLANMDRNAATIKPILREIYGPDQAKTWWHYWRVFFMACAELWGYRGGNEWFVSHYRFSAK